MVYGTKRLGAAAICNYAVHFLIAGCLFCRFVAYSECNRVTYKYGSPRPQSTTFYSPNFPRVYPANVACILYWFVGDANHIVQLRFLEFDLESGASPASLSRSSRYVPWPRDCYCPVSAVESSLFSERSLYAIARPSVVCLSVTLVRPTQAVQIFGNISTALGTLAIP